MKYLVEVVFVKNKDYEASKQSRKYSYVTNLELQEDTVVYVPVGKNSRMTRALVVGLKEYKELPYDVKEVGTEELKYTVEKLSSEVMEEKEEVEKPKTKYFNV